MTESFGRSLPLTKTQYPVYTSIIQLLWLVQCRTFQFVFIARAKKSLSKARTTPEFIRSPSCYLVNWGSDPPHFPPNNTWLRTRLSHKWMHFSKIIESCSFLMEDQKGTIIPNNVLHVSFHYSPKHQRLTT